MKWSSESLMAAVAVVVTTGGGILTTAIHWGNVSSSLEAVQKRQDDEDRKIEDNRRALGAQQVHDAAVEQKLDDLKDQLTRIEKKL